MNEIVILEGDSLEVLKDLPDNSVDSVVTDPPYGLSFMGKKWDYDVPSVELWCEVLRVLKPGGHLLSFGGTRTYHRMVVNIEDAGFEIRDQIQWIYGSGFPKSQNVAIQIDKQAGAIGHRGKALNMSGKGDRLDIVTYDSAEGLQSAPAYEPATDAAKQWQGWGTALKPANEPICLARKPLEKGLTVAENVLKYGTGSLNIDASRIEGKLDGDPNRFKKTDGGWGVAKFHEQPVVRTEGRWPANVLFDGDAADLLDEQTAGTRASKPSNTGTKFNATGLFPIESEPVKHDDSGGASRFFYVAKASKRERNAGLEGMPEKESGVKNDSGRGFSEGDPYKKVLNQNNHPTVKPVKLMEYLVKLVTPPNGVVLDPFVGSGSTLVAVKNLGFSGIGIEREPEYAKIAIKRTGS